MGQMSCWICLSIIVGYPNSHFLFLKGLVFAAEEQETFGTRERARDLRSFYK